MVVRSGAAGVGEPEAQQSPSPSLSLPQVIGSVHELDRCGNPARGEDGIDVVPVDVGSLALLDVTLNGIDPDDVSFWIRSPHRAEASL